MQPWGTRAIANVARREALSLQLRRSTEKQNDGCLTQAKLSWFCHTALKSKGLGEGRLIRLHREAKEIDPNKINSTHKSSKTQTTKTLNPKLQTLNPKLKAASLKPIALNPKP